MDVLLLDVLIKLHTVVKHEKDHVDISISILKKILEHFLRYYMKYYTQFERNNYPSGPFFHADI